MAYERLTLINEETHLDKELFEHLENGIINVEQILDKDPELMEANARLNANTMFASGYTTAQWGPFKSAVPTVDGDCVKITCNGKNSLQGIRRTPPKNIPVGTKIRVTFWYKKDSAYTPTGVFKFYVTDSAENLTFTDEWKQFKKDYTWDGSWDRLQFSSPTTAQELVYYVKDFSIIDLGVSTVLSRLKKMEDSFNHPLAGKNIAVIGDSISTGSLNPYFIVRSVDVGKTIQSYVTHYDVYVGTEGTPTEKTIGGVILTDDMIGTLQSFTPVEADIGKTIGNGVSYYNSSVDVWHKVLKEKTGAARVINASWSGSRLHSGGDKGDDRLSTAWSDYTIGRCKTRDADGNDILPDVIFIYRGTNDYSKSDPFGYIDELDLMGGIPESDVLEDGRISSRIAYYLTIQKLRQTYPKAIVVCCTLNSFKRGANRTAFPVNNGHYTLPDMNNMIREVADVTGCPIVEFAKSGITFENLYSEGYVTDSADMPTHPNATGHAVMAERAYQDTKLLNLL